MQVPDHLPENRAIANATQRTGPTKDDYKAMRCYKTPLFAKCSGSTDEPAFDFSFDPRRSMKHDPEFGSLLRTLGDTTHRDAFVYIPGTVTGVWEGICRVSSMVYFPILPTLYHLTDDRCPVKEYETADCYESNTGDWFHEGNAVCSYRICLRIHRGRRRRLSR